MGKGGVYREYFSIFFPVYFSGIITFVFVLTDTAFIAGLGDKELAGVGLAGTFIVFASAIFESMSQAVGVRVSKAYGANLFERVRMKVYSGFVMVVAVSVVFTVFFGVSKEYILNVFNASTEVLSHTVAYYGVWVWSIPFMALSVYFSVLLNNLKKSAANTYITAVVIVLNVFANYVFIYGIEDVLDPMGVAGASLGTASVFAFQALIKGWYVYKSGFLKKYSMGVLKLKKIALEHARLMSHFLIGGILWPVSAIVFNVVVSNYSDGAIAAYTLTQSVKMFLFGFTMGTATTLMILVSRYRGEKSFGKVKTVFALTVKMVVAWASVMMLISLFLSHEVGVLFLETEESLAVFETVWWVTMVTSVTWATAANLNKLFIALGREKFATYVNFAGNFAGICLPPFVSYYFGLVPFLASVATIGTLVLLSAILIYRSKIRSTVC